MVFVKFSQTKSMPILCRSITLLTHTPRGSWQLLEHHQLTTRKMQLWRELRPTTSSWLPRQLYLKSQAPVQCIGLGSPHETSQTRQTTLWPPTSESHQSHCQSSWPHARWHCLSLMPKHRPKIPQWEAD